MRRGGVRVSTDLTRREQIVASLQDKEYRDAFVEEHIDSGVAFQIRATREAQGWSQRELGRRAGMAQERVSVLEDPDYGRMSLSTLKRVASALDVALVVRFVPFSQLADWATELSAEALAVPNFARDPDLQPAGTLGSVTPAIDLTLPNHGTGGVPLVGSLRSTIGRLFAPVAAGTSAAPAYGASTAGAPMVTVPNG